MKKRTLLAGLLIGSTLSLLVVQAGFSEPLPFPPNRPERGPASGPPVPDPSPHLQKKPADKAHAAQAKKSVSKKAAPRPASERVSLGGPSSTSSGPPDLPPYLVGALPPALVPPARSADPAPAPSLAVTRAATIGAERSAAKKGTLSGPLPPKQGAEGPAVLEISAPMNRLVREYINTYTSQSGRRWLRIVLRRSKTFRGYIASRIQHYHLPPSLVFLPIVESTYNTYAVSQAGAAGLWQLMPSSAYLAGLHINEWMDQRFDFWKATNASLEKLRYNYDVLGNWLLALAAYNVGLNYVQQVVRRTGIRNVWELGAKGYLPYETRVYIPKFLALARICSFPGRYGLPVSWQKPLKWTRIRLHQAVDLRILARDAGINESLLLEGNAELRYDITPPGDSDYYLKVPKRDYTVIERVLRDRKHHLMRFYIYTIKQGDTLYDLSMYYGVPVSMILQYNPGVSAHYLQIGEHIVIPGVKNVPPYQQSYAKKLQSQGPKITLHDPSGRFTGLYTVRPGDTLWGIAQRYGITAAKLARVNGITESTIIHQGNVLHVPGPGALVTQGGN